MKIKMMVNKIINSSGIQYTRNLLFKTTHSLHSTSTSHIPCDKKITAPNNDFLLTKRPSTQKPIVISSSRSSSLARADPPYYTSLGSCTAHAGERKRDARAEDNNDAAHNGVSQGAPRGRDFEAGGGGDRKCEER